jgi:dephospho-CoA kinase
MLRIGLTGGIGSGKSTVCRLFADLGVPVIDTDRIAHAIVAPGKQALGLLAEAFGPDILDGEGALDRAVLRERVFRDEAMRERLEAILHPLIRKQLHSRLETLDAPYVIIAIPLLLEKGWQSEVDRILVVDADEAAQIERTMRRDGVSSELVQRIMQAQVSRTERVEAAGDIIYNNGRKDALKARVDELHQRYLRMAAGE